MYPIWAPRLPVCDSSGSAWEQCRMSLGAQVRGGGLRVGPQWSSRWRGPAPVDGPRVALHPAPRWWGTAGSWALPRSSSSLRTWPPPRCPSAWCSLRWTSWVRGGPGLWDPGLGLKGRTRKRWGGGSRWGEDYAVWGVARGWDLIASRERNSGLGLIARDWALLDQGRNLARSGE